jgi:hypothetical protein
MVGMTDPLSHLLPQNTRHSVACQSFFPKPTLQLGGSRQERGAAGQDRAARQAEQGEIDGSQQPAVVQLTTAAIERHLQGMTEKLRSGMTGRVREAIQQSIARIVVRVDGSLTIEAKPKGILGLEGSLSQLECQEGRTLIEPNRHSAVGIQWGLVTAL